MIYTYDIEEHYKDIIDRVYKGVIDQLGYDDIFDTEISFVSEEEIQRVNRETRGIDRVTDVLSFPYLEIHEPFNRDDYELDVDPSTGNIVLGDIIICEKRMEEQAIEYGHSNDRECAFLTTHGLLHLMGYDHIEESDRVKMRAQEDAILSKLGITREV